MDIKLSEDDLEIVTEGKHSVVIVKGGEQYVEDRTKEAAGVKAAAKLWDQGKKTFRAFGTQVLSYLEEKELPPMTAYFKGLNDHVIEVSPSPKRKNLSEALVMELGTAGHNNMVVKETTVTLTGILADWAKTALGNRPNDPNMKVSEKVTLAPEFEALRKKIRAQKSDLPKIKFFDRVTAEGLQASSVEAKTRKA